MVRLTAAEYKACWSERLGAKERAIVNTDLQDQGAAEKQELEWSSSLSDITSQLSSKRGPKPQGSTMDSAVSSVVGSKHENDKLSSMSRATESVVSSHVSSLSVSMRKIEMLKQQLEQVRSSGKHFSTANGTTRRAEPHMLDSGKLGSAFPTPGSLFVLLVAHRRSKSGSRSSCG
jgi:hypothetical protein